ncbi:MAG: amino acid decarboxylase [Oscillospiraceae bacterium]|nr:amino acid decarboxylase [Oscillospiraceae bacterium]
MEPSPPERGTLTAALEALSGEGYHRFHLPGHKGVLPPPLDGAARIDMTELSRTGNLYDGRDGPIRRAERRCADLYGAGDALFLTGGATQGVLAMLAAFAQPTVGCEPTVGDIVAVDRGCHRSVYAAMALLDLKPLYLTRERLAPCGAGAPLEPSPLPEETACVVLTCPTYYGVRSPDRGWRTVSGRPVPVLADAAHGAHLPFLPDGASPLEGARAAVCSAHKTLPALGQAAFLLLRDAGDASRARQMTALFGTASPSYPVMASMDAAFAALERDGAARWAETAAYAAELRAGCRGLLADAPDVPLDAARLCLYTGNGFRDAARLEREHGILCEMADAGSVVFILTPHDPPESRSALRRALGGFGDLPSPYTGRQRPPPLPEQALTLREAMFAPCEAVRLSAAVNRVAARALAPFPPGIPVAAPGEVIGKLHIEILSELWYDKEEEEIWVVA